MQNKKTYEVKNMDKVALTSKNCWVPEAKLGRWNDKNSIVVELRKFFKANSVPDYVEEIGQFFWDFVLLNPRTWCDLVEFVDGECFFKGYVEPKQIDWRFLNFTKDTSVFMNIFVHEDERAKFGIQYKYYFNWLKKDN